VFDYWQEKLIGSYSDEINVEIPPHGTRVMTIRKLLPRPQMLAVNRHITGAFSIQNLTWDEENSEMKGLSQTVPGSVYKLFIHVPGEFSIEKMDANANGLKQALKEDGILEVELMGQEEPVEWAIQFNR